MVILEIESQELFAKASLELQSSSFQTPKVAGITDVSHQHLAYLFVFFGPHLVKTLYNL
jgi:hypothetical protein